MIRGDLDYDKLEVQAQDDPMIAKALSAAASEVKYNTRLYDFLEMAYPWQKKAVQMTKDHRVMGLIASNQSGKSETACSVVACHATGIYPDWWEGRMYNRPVKIMVAGVDGNHNKNVLQDKLIGTNNWRLKNERGTGMIPKDNLIAESAVTVRGDDLSAIKIKHITGGMSEIIFRAYSQGREAAQGFQADLILIDEQPKDDFWSEALVRTAATNGQVVCSFTPLLGMTGLVEELMGLESEEDSAEDKFGKKYKSEGGWSMVRATWEDINHISEEDKAQLRKGFAAYEADARTFGVPIAGHGRIFPYQHSEITYSPRETMVSDRFDHLIGIDIGHGHGRDPSAAVLVAYDELLDTIYVKEARLASTDTTRDLGRLIATLDHTVNVAWPSDANRSSMNSQSTVADQLRQLEIKLLTKPFLNPRGADGKQNNFKAPGINEINSRFAEGKLKISTDCVSLLKEMEQYSYTETGKIQDGKDHCIDAFRYAVMSVIQGLGAPLKDNPWEGIDYTEEFHYNSY